MENKYVSKKRTYESRNCLIVCGAGKFDEEKLFLNKEQAMLLYIDLHKFISKPTPKRIGRA